MTFSEGNSQTGKHNYVSLLFCLLNYITLISILPFYVGGRVDGWRYMYRQKDGSSKCTLSQLC